MIKYFKGNAMEGKFVLSKSEFDMCNNDELTVKNLIECKLKQMKYIIYGLLEIK